MKKKQNLGVQIFAGLALFGIILSVIGVGIIALSGWNEPQTISSQELQDLIDSGEISISTSTGATVTGSWSEAPLEITPQQ
jgi:hypothetical protein